MAVTTALTNSLTPVSALDDLSKLDLTDDFDTPHLAESVNGWCGGDFSGEEQETSIVASLREEIKFKDTLINELQNSNHELRLKLAETETKIAQMRVKIDSHCECCTKSAGLADFVESKRYPSNDWSSIHSFGVDFAYLGTPVWNREVVKGPFDNTNPYVKVRNWQDNIPGEVSRETDSASSSHILKRSPDYRAHRSGNAIPESPATSGHIGDYILIPMRRSSPSSGVRRIDTEESSIGSPQRLSLSSRRDQHPSGYATEEEISSPRLPTIKSSPDERVSSRQERCKSHTSAPSAMIRSSPRDYENVEISGMDRYRQAVIQTMRNSWVEHENHPHLSTWNRPNDSGIVGRLMRDNNRK